MTKLEKAERLALDYAEQITELENQIADIKANCDLAIEGRDIKIKELKEKISVLLSCKNCPENKGGYICAKEYENKCLAQKIQHIKELQKENAELDMKRKAERQIFQGIVEKKNEQLTKAKEIIRTFLNMPMPNNEEVFADVGIFLTKAEQFIKEIK